MCTSDETARARDRDRTRQRQTHTQTRDIETVVISLLVFNSNLCMGNLGVKKKLIVLKWQRQKYESD